MFTARFVEVEVEAAGKRRESEGDAEEKSDRTGEKHNKSSIHECVGWSVLH